MQKVEVKLPDDKYRVLVGSGLLSSLGPELKGLGFRSKAIVITNPVINKLYGGVLKESLDESGFDVAILTVPEGEQYKSLEEAGKLYTELSKFQVERLSPVLALGGGVIGDLAGFVAATFMRGVPLVHVPTSLLAQVDSSIGGKVAVNHGKLKNTIGCFYQPRLVVSDISMLKTLPENEFVNGLAEVIKYGIIRDKELFGLVEENIDQIRSRDERLLEDVIFRCVSIKAAVIQTDEKDLGLRNILNFGHTVGHAIEAASGLRIAHGRAVAVGMVAASRISGALGFLPETDSIRIEYLLEKAGLLSGIMGLDPQRVMEAMEHDKKKLSGKIRFILVKGIGEGFIYDEVSHGVGRSVLGSLL